MATASIRLQASGERQVAGAFGRVKRDLNKTGAASRRISTGMQRDWSKVGRSVGGLGKILGGIGLAAGAKRVMDFRQRLGQLQADANLSTNEARKLGSEILGLQSKFNISKDSITDAVQVFQDFGGIVKEGRTILGGLTRISKATGTEMKDLATIASTLIQTMKIKPTEALTVITQMNAQALAGQISLKNMAKVMPELASAGKNAGISVQEIGIALQTVGQATGGNVDTARTALVALMSQLQAQSKKLKKRLKVDVFTTDAKTGIERMRSLKDIMEEIFKATKGKLSGKKGLLEFFNLESKKAVDAFSSSFDAKTGKLGGTFGTVQKATKGAKISDVDAQLARRVGGIAKEAEEVEGALKKLDEALQKHGGQILSWASQNKAQAAGAGLGLVAAVKLGPSLLKWASKLRLGGGKGAAGGMGGVGGLLPGGGVQPVFVVNLPGANIGQAAGFFGAGGSGAGGAAAPKTGKFRTAMGKLGTAAGGAGSALGALMVGVQVGTMLDNWLGLSDKMANAGHSFIATITGGKDELSVRKAMAKKRVEFHTKSVKEQAVIQEAQTLAGLKAGGVKSVGKKGGPRTALTDEGISKLVAQSAKAQGISGEQFEKLVSVIDKKLQGIKITARPADGLDKAKVEVDRGARQ